MRAHVQAVARCAGRGELASAGADGTPRVLVEAPPGDAGAYHHWHRARFARQTALAERGRNRTRLM
jgi:hypothetical protein